MKSREEIKKLLVVVDMVNGFIKSGVMHDEDINRITPRIKSLVEKYLSEKEGVAFIKDTHTDDSVEFRKFPPHCVVGTGEEELIDELKPYEQYGMSFEKNSTSTMYAPGFMKEIDAMPNLEEVVISGCCTDICVLNLALPLTNYFDQNNRMVEIRVPENVVETYNSETHNREEYNQMSLKLLKQAGIGVERI